MNANSTLTQDAVIAGLPGEAKPHAFIVGAWVWVEFPEKPEAETRDALKALGFRFNAKRSAWQHSCGHFTRHAPYDPRGKYGKVRVEEVA